MLCEASGRLQGSARSVPPGSGATRALKAMRFSRRKSIRGRPTCTALNPNTSSTALSTCAISQAST